MTAIGVPGPSAQRLHAAREAVLAAMPATDWTGGHAAAQACLAKVSAGDIIDVAAILATLLARPADVLLTVGEFGVLLGQLAPGPDLE